jgi:hypothetical protein
MIASSIFGDFVLGFDAGNEVVYVFMMSVFYAKIVDDQR